MSSAQDTAIAAGKAALRSAVIGGLKTATRPGVKTSEFWASVLGWGVAGGLGGLALVAASPLLAIPAGAIALGAAAYAKTRGNLKAAALSACKELARHLPGEDLEEEPKR